VQGAHRVRMARTRVEGSHGAAVGNLLDPKSNQVRDRNGSGPGALDQRMDGGHGHVFMTTVMYTVKPDSIVTGGLKVRVTREQASAHREKILDVAATLFRERGFDGIGVADIMNRAGLTHGGFYGHFGSKDDLASEVTARVLARPGWLERLTGTPEPSLGKFVRSYLSPRHRDNPGRGCLFAALGSDVTRQPPSVRRAFTEGLQLRIDALRRLMPGRSAARRRRQALATTAGLVGALILSRAVDDSKLSAEILEAAAASLGRSQPKEL
jgi:TetR/AcrR family transcriptional repressor of nem operon